MRFLKKIIAVNLLIAVLLLLLAGCSGQAEDAEITDTADAPAVEAIAIDTADSQTTTDSSEVEETEETATTEEIAITDAESPLSGNITEITEESGIKENCYIFTYNNITIYLDEHTERILNELGEWRDYAEMQSCSFDGIAKLYIYNGFEISTYLKNKTDNDRIYSVTLNDDSVTTVEGMYIGQTFDDMVAIYGAEYKETAGTSKYKYEKGGTVLAFSIEDGIIISISYEVADMYE